MSDVQNEYKYDYPLLKDIDLDGQGYVKASRASGMPDTLKTSGGSPNPLQIRGKKYPRRRSANIAIHVTPQEKDMILSKAESVHMTITDFIISAVKEERIVVCEDLTPLFTELKRIGNNVNQIAFKVNSGAVSAVELTETRQELSDISRQLAAIARRIYGNN